MTIDINPSIAQAPGTVPAPAPTPRAYVPRIDENNFDQDAWDDWYREQIRLSIEDPRPNVPHEEVMRDAWKMLHPDADTNDAPFDQASWDEWYRGRLRQSIADPRPRVPHEAVMEGAWQLLCELEARHARKET